MFRKKDRIPFAWHNAHFFGILILVVGFIEPATIVKYLQNFMLWCFLINCLDIVVAKYQRRNFEAVSSVPNHYVMITGPTSGIGKEMAYYLAKKKFSLILAARSESVLEKMKKEIEEVNNVQVHYCVCDLSTSEGIEKLIQFVTENKFQISILINNAGIAYSDDFENITKDQISSIMTLDVIAVVQLTHAILPIIQKRKKGHIMNVASIAAAAPVPYMALYAAAKAFVNSFTLALNYELLDSGVTVTSFCPGPVNTNIFKASAIEGALLAKIASFTMPAKECAKVGVDAMLEGEDCTFDSASNRAYAYVNKCLIPRHLCLMLGSLVVKK